MLQKMLKTQRTVLTVILLLSTISIVSISKVIQVLPTIIPVAQAYPNGTIKPLNFYFHNDTSNPWVGSGYTRTTATLNTTRNWLETPQGFVNASGTLVLEFYVHPDLAANVTLSGTLWLHLWMCGRTPTGATPKATFKADIYEVVSPTGPTKVASTGSSGSMELAYGSAPAHSRDVNSVNGNPPLNLTFTSHTFTKGSSILLRIEIVPGAGVSMSFYYDNIISPSFVTLYSNDYAQISTLKTYAFDDSETNLFYYNWSESQRKVIVRANVTDPFGGYDIYRVNITILDPEGNPVVDNADMTRVSDGQWLINYAHLFEANWSYPTTAALGNYTVTVSMIDNNGYYQNIDMGTFEPFIEEATHIFTIGVIVYYDPAFLVTDDADNPLPNAQVYITWTNGTTEKLPRYTATDGFINLTQVSAGNYGFTILWKDMVVQQTTVYVDSDGPYIIKTRVYQLTVEVLGNNRMSIQGAYVIVYTQSGVGYGLDTTDAAGQALFQLPAGEYRIEAHYSSGYWLTVVRTSATEPVSVTASTSKTVILDDFPPAVWTTLGFWVLIISLVVPVIAVVFFLYKKGKILGR